MSATRLAPLTTLGLGGPADVLVEATTEDALVAAVLDADAEGRPLLLLGGGSNVVLADAGFRGTAVLVRTRGTTRDGTRLQVAAGEPWDDLVATAVGAQLAGVEALSGIPGSTGATPVQNVGAYGQEVAQTITAVRALDRERREVVELDAAACGFGYRTSRFKRERGRWVVLSVTFGLTASELSAPVQYDELARALGIEVGGRAPLADVREAVLRLRAGKGMVTDPADPDTRSVGSFFTNPVVAPAVAAEVERRSGERPAQWPEPDGRVKLSAAWLVQHAGFARGHGSTAARISGKHALALTCGPGGTTADLVALAAEVRDGVLDRLGVELVPEPDLVGVALPPPRG